MKIRKKAILFNEDDRRDFITGFHKRKLARKKKLDEKFEEQLKEAKKKIKTQARETYRKIINVHELSTGYFNKNETQYDLPNHSVTIRELSNDDIAANNDWIGTNNGFVRGKKNFDAELLNDEAQEDSNEPVPGMNLNSIKEIKKIVNKQSKALVQCDKIFKKKNKLERLKNRKQAARKKKLREKQKGKKGKKRCKK